MVSLMKNLKVSLGGDFGNQLQNFVHTIDGQLVKKMMVSKDHKFN